MAFKVKITINGWWMLAAAWLMVGAIAVILYQAADALLGEDGRKAGERIIAALLLIVVVRLVFFRRSKGV